MVAPFPHARCHFHWKFSTAPPPSQILVGKKSDPPQNHHNPFKVNYECSLSSVSAATGIITEIAGLTGNGNYSGCQRSSSAVVVAAIAITFGHCYIGITKNNY